MRVAQRCLSWQRTLRRGLSSHPVPKGRKILSFNEKLERQDWTTAPEQRTEDLHVPISAHYVGRNVDVVKLARNLSANLRGATVRRQPSYILIGLNTSVLEQLAESPVKFDESDGPGYVAVFRFGSVAFLGVEDKHAQHAVIEHVRPFVSLPLLQAPPPPEEHAMWLRAKGAGLMDFPNETPAERLDRNAVVVICTVLAQSVALDAHAENADRLLEMFRGFNELVLKSGRIPDRVDRQKLFTLIAENNSIHADVISGSRLSLFDKTEEGWRDAKTWQLSQDLREEFEMEERYSALETKMDLIHDSSKFFMEVLHNSHSNRIETAILALIFLEVILAVVHKI